MQEPIKIAQAFPETYGTRPYILTIGKFQLRKASIVDLPENLFVLSHQKHAFRSAMYINIFCADLTRSIVAFTIYHLEIFSTSRLEKLSSSVLRNLYNVSGYKVREHQRTHHEGVINDVLCALSEKRASERARDVGWRSARKIGRKRAYITREDGEPCTYGKIYSRLSMIRVGTRDIQEKKHKSCQRRYVTYVALKNWLSSFKKMLTKSCKKEKKEKKKKDEEEKMKESGGSVRTRCWRATYVHT